MPKKKDAPTTYAHNNTSAIGAIFQVQLFTGCYI